LPSWWQPSINLAVDKIRLLWNLVIVKFLAVGRTIIEPLIILVVVTLALLAAGAAGVRWLRPWPVALRGGLAAMFVTTGLAHFVGLRAELISMVPPGLPAPGLLITVTGVLELAGALGLLWTPTSPWAAGGLSALLVALFPANVYAALEGLTSAPSDQLGPRSAIQLVFLAATLTVLVHHLRARRRTRSAADDAREPQVTGAPAAPS
jgi:uncharacterized membrane protein